MWGWGIAEQLRVSAFQTFNGQGTSRHVKPDGGSGQIAGDQRSCRDRGPDRCEQAQQHSCFDSRHKIDLSQRLLGRGRGSMGWRDVNLDIGQARHQQD
jgi:hypothetical protein